MNFALQLAAEQDARREGGRTRFDGDPRRRRALLLTDAPPQTREAIDKGHAEQNDPAAIAGLILGSPEFQKKVTL